MREPGSPSAQTSRNRETKTAEACSAWLAFYGNRGVCGQWERETEHPSMLEQRFSTLSISWHT